MTKIYLKIDKKYNCLINKQIKFLYFIFNKFVDFSEEVKIFSEIFLRFYQIKKKFRIKKKIEKCHMNYEINKFNDYEKIGSFIIFAR